MLGVACAPVDQHMEPRVAVLYVERGGPYFAMADVDPWDAARDARTYAGPMPILNPRSIASPSPGRKPTHGIWYGDFERAGRAGERLLGASKEIRPRTPPAFARWLVDLASGVSR